MSDQHADLVKLHEKKVKLHQKNGGWFVGTRIVKEAVENTDLGLVGVLYDDGGEETFTQRQWESARAHGEYPQDQVSKRRFAAAIREIQALVVDNTKDEKTRIDGIMELLVKERADLNSFAFIVQNAGEAFKKTEALVHQRVQDIFNKAISVTFSVEHQTQITLQELIDSITPPATTVPEETTEEVEQSVEETTEESTEEST